MTITLTHELIEKLRVLKITTLHNPGVNIPDQSTFEAPCSFKWMSIDNSIYLGAFSYAVSGFYYACKIGRYCSFGENVQIGRNAHPMHYFSTSPFFYLDANDILGTELFQNNKYDHKADFFSLSPPAVVKTTIIGNDVWIGHGAFLLPGIKVGHGAVIAAQAVVTKDVPPYAVVAGCPAKIIKYKIDERLIKSMLEVAWWDFAPWQLKGAKLDSLEEFIQFAGELREIEKPYCPPLTRVTDLV